MDIQLPSTFTTLMLLSSFMFLLIKVFKKSKLEKNYEHLPPSPPKLPLVGHLHHMAGWLPHRVLAGLAQDYGPILHLQLGEVSAVVISSPKAAKAVLKDQDPACADRPASIGSRITCYDYRDIVFSPYNEFWKQMRRICMFELLSAKSVKSFGSIREDEVSGLLNSLKSFSGESVNLTEKVLAMNGSIICRAALGKVSRDDCKTLIAIFRAAAARAVGFELADFFPSSKLVNTLSLNKYRLLKLHHKLDKIIDGIVKVHEQNTGGECDGEDIVDVLLRTMRNEELKISITRDNIKAIIFDMFAAGSDTASTTIDWAMAELMRNPHIMAKLQQEVREAFKGKMRMEESDLCKLKYLKLVTKETLRLHPPVPLLLRACRDECKVDGYSVPLKSKVIVNVWFMGRDPNYWEKPQMFLPERFEDCSTDFLGNNFEFIPFGAGKRRCPGIYFGMANIELALAQLLYHFDWKMPQGMSPDDIDMTEGGLVASRKNGLFLVPNVYNASN